ncbi:MAG TPA: protein kinase, partial [Dongiaceae bacterium]|nr:protein kinase [Dongiaceae bacterium]
NLDVDLKILDLLPGDLFLLTTDGVHGHIDARELQQRLLDGEKDLDALAQALVQRALDNGSDDNLSCQLVRVQSVGQETNEDVFRTLHQLPFPPDLSVGMKLDGWRVQQQLHASTRSQLYVVQHETSGQRAVMKTPSRNFIDDPAYIERFLMEEWVGRRIDSPYVVKVVEPPASRSFLYYLTEYVEGPTLAKWSEQHRAPDVTLVVAIADKLAQGLRAFHRRETLHQDLKPDNVVLRGEDPILIDFGSVYVAGVDEIATTFAREQALGTLDYSAPEYRLQRPRTAASDQFSLAVVLYELLTGHPPFGEAYQKAVKPQDFLALKYVPAYRRNPLVPLWMDGALRKAMQINAELRYESLSEFVHDLKNPNPSYLKADQRPLLEKDPVRFWKGLSLALLLINLVLLGLLVT